MTHDNVRRGSLSVGSTPTGGTLQNRLPCAMTFVADGVGPADLAVRQYDQGGTRFLELAGECDLSTHEQLRAGLADALAAPSTMVVVDLTRLEFCDGRCADELIRAAANTQLALVGATGIVARIFDLLDPAEALPRYPSPREAETGGV